MLLGVLRTILMIATMGGFCNAQQTYQLCYICGQGSTIRDYYDIIVLPNNAPFYCGSVQNDGLLGIIDPAACLWIQNTVQNRYYCSCEATIQAPVFMPQQKPTPPTAPTAPTAPPQRLRPVATPTDDETQFYDFLKPLISMIALLGGVSCICYVGRVTCCSRRY